MGDLMLVYDVWIDDVWVGRYAERLGECAVRRAKNVRFMLVTDADGRLARA